MKFLKTVFHVHTDYSDDSDNSIEHLIESAEQSGVHCLAITDHDSIAGARALAKAAGTNLKVIVGEEISTAQGHLIGLFLTERIRPGMSVRDTAQAIKKQGGLVVVPHPFNVLFDCGLRRFVHQIVDLIDIVEVANAQNLLPFPNIRAARFARQHALPALVGVDTHHRGSLGACYQWLEPFDGPVSFLEATRQAKLVHARHTLRYFARAAVVIVRSRLGLALPERYGRHCTSSRHDHLGRTPGTSIQTEES